MILYKSQTHKKLWNVTIIHSFSKEKLLFKDDLWVSISKSLKTLIKKKNRILLFMSSLHFMLGKRSIWRVVYHLTLFFEWSFCIFTGKSVICFWHFPSYYIHSIKICSVMLLCFIHWFVNWLYVSPKLFMLNHFNNIMKC